MTDREATIKAYNALHFNLPVIEDYGSKEQLEVQHNAINALDHALAQPEQTKCPRCGEVNPAEIHTCSPQVAQPEQDKLLVDLVQEQRAEIDRLRHALTQPEQKPVAYLCENAVGYKYFRWKKPTSHYKPIALYTAPPKREWVGLTDAELAEFSDMKLGAYDLCLEVEAKLEERNNG